MRDRPRLWPVSSIRDSLEVCLLVECCGSKAASNLRRIARRRPDWATLLRHAQGLGVAPFLYWNLKHGSVAGEVPSETINSLRNSYFWSAARNRDLQLRLADVLISFNRLGIAVIVLKGAALAFTIYPNPGLRPMADLDLLIRKDDIACALEILQELGYAPSKISNPAVWYEEHQHQHCTPYVSNDGQTTIELHHDLLPANKYVHVPIEQLWRHARPIAIDSAQSLGLSLEDLLLHLCLHVSFNDGFLGWLRYACDVSVILDKFEQELNWHQFVENARAYGVARYAYYALWMAEQTVTDRIPTVVMTDLKRFANTVGLQDWLLKSMIARTCSSRDAFQLPEWLVIEIYEQLLQPTSSIDKLLALIALIWRALLCSAQASVPSLPRPLILLYAALIHPCCLAGRALVQRKTFIKHQISFHRTSRSIHDGA